MYICIECGHKINELILKLSKTLEISKCKNCNRKCDKYLELSTLMTFIDLLLLKKKTFRHLVFNINYFNKREMLFLFLAILFSKFIHLARISKGSLSLYLFLLIAIEFMICFGFTAILNRKQSLKTFYTLIISSFYYLFTPLTIPWNFFDVEYYIVIEVLVVISNITALYVLTDQRNNCIIFLLFRIISYLITFILF